MKFISHRRNTIEELQATPTEYGVEVDIRSDNGKLVIHHDPFTAGRTRSWSSSSLHDALLHCTWYYADLYAAVLSKFLQS